MNRPLFWPSVVLAAAIAGSGSAAIIQAIIPQAVPTPNKRGTSTIFALADSTTPGSAGAAVCDNGSGQFSTSGCTGSVNVNGSPVSSPNFNGTTPTAPTTNPAGGRNITFQVSGANISGYALGFVPRPDIRETWDKWWCNGSDSSIHAAGYTAVIEAGGAGQGNPVSGLPASCLLTTGAVSGNEVNVNTAKSNWRTGTNIWSYHTSKISTASTIRLWIGFNDQGTVTNITNTDTACTNQNCAMFRYSTGAADTHYQCITNSGGASPTTTDSGIAADTSAHRFQIIFNDSVPNVVFEIDGATVCTMTTTLPSANTNMALYFTTTTLTAAAETLTFYNAYTEADH